MLLLEVQSYLILQRKEKRGEEFNHISYGAKVSYFGSINLILVGKTVIEYR